MAVLLVASERFELHVTPPGHPERTGRAEVFSGVALTWRERGGIVTEPKPAEVADLARVHSPAYIDRILATAGRAVRLDPDTYTSPESVDVARLAAGAVLAGVDHALQHDQPAVALVRPPGHHAERDTAMGFCLFNNVAAGASYARVRGLSRVAIVDFDVHHGNGTQAMFYEDPSVLYVSLHQYPYYPGTGGPAEIGTGSGTGFTVNAALEAGAADADYDHVMARLVVPILEAFKPELLLLSAGFDAHQSDPLAAMRLTSDGFAAIMGRLWRVANRVCKGRCVAVTEGGYDLAALADGVRIVLDTLSRPDRDLPVVHGDPAKGREAIALVRPILQPYWPTI
ncbi:MAG: histone deacetylase [Vicinamibacterales bacterium]